MLSWLVHGDSPTPVTGLRAFAPADRPPVNLVFQTYHLMVAIGMGLIGLAWLGVFLLWRKASLPTRAGCSWSSSSPCSARRSANQLGWFSAEVGPPAVDRLRAAAHLARASPKVVRAEAGARLR